MRSPVSATAELANKTAIMDARSIDFMVFSLSFARSSAGL